MQDSLKYLCAQFGYDWTKNEEMVKGGSNGPLPNLFNLGMPNPCKVKEINGYVRLTLDKFPGIQTDLVRIGEDWQEMNIKQNIKIISTVTVFIVRNLGINQVTARQ